MVESCSTLPGLFVFTDFSSSRIWRWIVFWKNDKTKRADYTKHQKSAGASLSLQSDVLCNRLWKIKVGFCFIPCRMNRLIMSQYGRTFIFSCYVWVDIFSTALLYKNGLLHVNVANVNYIRTEKWKIGFNKLDRSCFVITVSAEQLLTAQLIVIE